MTTKKDRIIITILGIVIVYLLANVIYSGIEYRKLWYKLALSNGEASYSNIDTVKFNNRNYYVDLIIDGHVASVWLRADSNGPKTDDILAMTVSSSITSYPEGLKEICRAKEEVEKGKVIIGCLSTAGSAACVFATAASDGATAEMCTEVWDYAIDAGFADCMDKIKEVVASKLIGDKNWEAIDIGTAITEEEKMKALSKVIDASCKDINKQVELEKKSIETKNDTPSRVSNPQSGPTASVNTKPNNSQSGINKDVEKKTTTEVKVENSQTQNASPTVIEPHLDPVPSGNADGKGDESDEGDKGGEIHIGVGDGGLGFMVNSGNHHILSWLLPVLISSISILICIFIIYKEEHKK